jgi:hypothetical protein
MSVDAVAEQVVDTGRTTEKESKRRKAKKPSLKAKAANAGNESTSKRVSKADGKRDAKPQRHFPNLPLEDALTIPQVIRAKAKGHPAEPKLIAKECALSPTSTKFFYLAAAARDYSLSVGTQDTDKIGLAELGRAIVFAPSADVERAKKIEAFFSVEKFKQVYDYYNGSDLPDEQYLTNTLETEFHIHSDHHALFVQVFKANCKYLGIEKGLGSVKPSEAYGKASNVEFRVLGQPQGDFNKTAFVIMPFSEKSNPPRSKGFFDEVLKSLITPAANAAGFAVKTARRDDTDIIHHTIIDQLLHAELVICDLTDHNPNVLFELGIRLTKELPVVLIKTTDTKPIFDVDHLMRVYPYNENLWQSTIEADVKALTNRIAGTWENKAQSVGYMRILTTGQAPTAAG